MTSINEIGSHSCVEDRNYSAVTPRVSVKRSDVSKDSSAFISRVKHSCTSDTADEDNTILRNVGYHLPVYKS
jgi:hypothetical protein